jgi:SAM-dependent methyltransferase
MGPDRADREALRRTFGEDAERYDRARPGYPEAMVDDLVRLAGLVPGDRVLEIGCGTGQLTVPLAARGLSVTCVELSGELAAVARRNLEAAQPAIPATVVEAAFEGWTDPGPPFDLLVAATSFHWVDPAVRVVKSVGLLRPGGSLAVIGTEHVAGPDGLFAVLQDCYVRWDPDVSEPSQLAPPEEMPQRLPELDESPLLGPVQLRRYVRDITYSTESYLDLLLTYSGHRALPAHLRDGLLGCIRSLIEARDGRITKTYLTELRLARRVA